MTLLFGAKLRHLRRRRHWTQADLAYHLGDVGRAHVGNVETNSRPPSLLFVIRVAALFDVASDYLLRDSILVDTITEHGAVDRNTQTTLPTLFGTKLRQLRQQQGVSQTELAEHLGLAAHAHISLLERGHHEPSIHLVLAIADYFGVSTDYLVWDDAPIAP